MKLDDIGEKLTELGNEWEDEITRVVRGKTNLNDLESIMDSYALYAGFLYGLAYTQNKALVAARDGVRQTMDVIEAYLSRRTENET